MKKLARVGIGAGAGVLACGAVAWMTVGTAFASPAPTPAPPVQTNPATPAPPPTNPPTTPPPPTTTTTTIPYYQVVQNDCADYPDDEALAAKLEEAKQNDGSSHLVSLAKYCGVLFAAEAEQDPELKRPRSNLEYASYEKNDPFYTPGWDDVTANDAQLMIVVEASTSKWYELNPTTTAAPVETTAAPTSVPASIVATTVAESSSTTLTNTTSPNDADTEQAPDEGGSDTVQILGMLLLAAGAVSWGVYGVMNDTNDESA